MRAGASLSRDSFQRWGRLPSRSPLKLTSLPQCLFPSSSSSTVISGRSRSRTSQLGSLLTFPSRCQNKPKFCLLLFFTHFVHRTERLLFLPPSLPSKVSSFSPFQLCLVITLRLLKEGLLWEQPKSLSNGRSSLLWRKCASQVEIGDKKRKKGE